MNLRLFLLLMGFQAIPTTVATVDWTRTKAAPKPLTIDPTRTAARRK